MKTVQTAVAIKNKKTGYIFVSTVAESKTHAWAKFDTLLDNSLDNLGERKNHVAINVRIEELVDEPITENESAVES